MQRRALADSTRPATLENPRTKAHNPKCFLASCLASPHISFHEARRHHDQVAVNRWRT
jgi:hypothetical protein